MTRLSIDTKAKKSRATPKQPRQIKMTPAERIAEANNAVEREKMASNERVAEADRKQSDKNSKRTFWVGIVTAVVAIVVGYLGHPGLAWFVLAMGVIAPFILSTSNIARVSARY